MSEKKHENTNDSKESRIWRLKKENLFRDLQRTVERSPVLRLLGKWDQGDSICAVLQFAIPTLVAPKPGSDRIDTDGPVVVGVVYRQRFLYEPPVPWEICTILSPQVFLPNSSKIHGGGLCLGSPPAAIPMEEIIHLTYAALTLSSVNTVSWEGMNRDAADFVRRHHREFPLLRSGLFEEPDPPLDPPLDGTLFGLDFDGEDFADLEGDRIG